MVKCKAVIGSAVKGLNHQVMINDKQLRKHMSNRCFL